MPFLLRWAINALALWVALSFVPGVEYHGPVAPFIVVALIFGVVNSLVRPVAKLVTCPFIVLTLGLFTFIVNAAMFWLTAVLAQALGIPFLVHGIAPAFFGALLASAVSAVLTLLAQPRRQTPDR